MCRWRLAAIVYGFMWIWHRGIVEIRKRSIVAELTRSADVPQASRGGKRCARSRIRGVPHAGDAGNPARHGLAVRQNRSLHEYVLALDTPVVSTPRVEPEERLTLTRDAENFWRAQARYGFMETPDIDALLAQCKAEGAQINLDDVTFYLGHETVVPREDHKGLPRWQVALFTAMGRNAARLSDFLELPHDQVVEIGREIAI